ncbi:hypothetical protein HQ576_00595, partial [bacterium]|nr:hypothetical protein [bacterium]
MKRTRNRRQGTALVIAVGLMSVLAVIGFGFAVVMRLHYDTSRYFRANAQIELLAQASIYYAIDEIRYGSSPARPSPEGTALTATTYDKFRHTRFTGSISEAIESPIAPWYIGARQASGLIEDGGVPRYHPM